VVEHYPGTGSTDFWGISFAFSTIDRQAMSSAELERELTLMRACWAFFDDVRSRVSAELRKGPRGGGRDRDQIVRHTFAAEQDWAKKLGVLTPPGALLTDAGLQAHRDAYCGAIRAFHAERRMARTWPLRYLIRHTAFHTLDHAWEMEDKDLTAERAGGKACETPIPYWIRFGTSVGQGMLVLSSCAGWFATPPAMRRTVASAPVALS
jgi:hypothetical protein